MRRSIQSTRGRGFTLIEIVVVVTIILILIAVFVPVALTVGSANLSQGIELLQGAITLARETAIRENRPVEVRFYSYVSPEVASPEAEFRAVQVLADEGDPAVAVPISELEKLPRNIVIINHPDYSTLVTAPELQASETVEIEGAAGDATFFSFLFLPDGSAALEDEEAGAWFLTIAEESKMMGAGGDLPRNYITLQIEPFTGAIRLLQPTAG